MTNMIARVNDTTNIFFVLKLAFCFNNRITGTKPGESALNRICHIYVTSNTHEQIFLIGNFSLPHKN